MEPWFNLLFYKILFIAVMVPWWLKLNVWNFFVWTEAGAKITALRDWDLCGELEPGSEPGRADQNDPWLYVLWKNLTLFIGGGGGHMEVFLLYQQDKTKKWKYHDIILLKNELSSLGFYTKISSLKPYMKGWPKKLFLLL
jgi:hypothetical protein